VIVSNSSTFNIVLSSKNPMASTSDLPRKLWEHPDPQSTQMWAFKSELEKEKGLQLPVRTIETSISLFYCGLMSLLRTTTLSIGGQQTIVHPFGTFAGDTFPSSQKVLTKRLSMNQPALTAFLPGLRVCDSTSPRICSFQRRGQARGIYRLQRKARKTTKLP
jgi:hypothetical protein